MEFANATYLWGLLGLILPIAIHLWSRKKVVTIKVGSTKLLQVSEPKQTSSFKMNEWWLLFLRLLTVLLLVFILSEPNLSRTLEDSKISYVVEPSLFDDHRMTKILDTLPIQSIRILEQGFPEWEGDKITEKTTPKYWQLANEMKKIAADSIVVFSRGLMKGIHGRRPRIEANTKWIVVEEESVERPISALQKEDYIELLTLKSNSKALSFKKDSIANTIENLEFNLSEDSLRLSSHSQEKWIAFQKNRPIRIGIVYDDSLRMQYEYLKAAYSAIAKFLDRPLEIAVLKELTSKSTINFNTLVSFNKVILKDSKIPMLIFKPNDFATKLVEPAPAANLFYLTALLNSENIVSGQLPERLLSLLNRHKKIEASILMNDQRVLATTALQPMQSKTIKKKNKASILKMTPWLWLFLIIVVLLERILSKIRKQ